MKKYTLVVTLLLVFTLSACDRWPLSAPDVKPSAVVPTVITPSPLPPIAQTAPVIASQHTETPVITTPTPPAPANAVLLTEMIEAYSESPAYTILLESIVMEGEPYYADPFNELVKELMEKEQTSFIEGLAEIEAWRAANMPDIRSTLDSTYQATYNDHSLVSIRFEFYSYTAGAAHPISYSKTLTYDLNQNRKVQLPDLFTMGTDWLGALSSFCLKDLQQQGVLEFPEGAEPVMKNYTGWSLTPDGMVVYFDPYQVASYAAGPQQVLVPYAALSEFISPQSVLSYLLP